MKKRFVFPLVVTTSLLAHARAQTTWIVDANNGPGTQFAEIQPAIDAANPGDIVLVRAGLYAVIAIDKSLTVQGDGGVTVQGDFGLFPPPPLSVTELSSGDMLTITGIDFVTNPVSLSAAAEISLDGGRVLLEQTSFSTNVSTASSADSMSIINAEVWISDADLDGIAATLSTVVLADSTSQGTLNLDNTAITISRTSVTGTVTGAHPAFGSPAISSTDSVIRLTDDGSNQILAGPASAGGVTAIDGTGTVIHDPNVVITPQGTNPAIAATLTTVVQQVTSVSASGGQLGGDATIEVFARDGDLYELFVGLPATPTSFPPFNGDLAMGTIILPVAQGFLGPTQSASIVVPIPPDPTFTGLTLCWQAVAGTIPAGLYFSNPDFTIVRS